MSPALWASDTEKQQQHHSGKQQSGWVRKKAQEKCRQPIWASDNEICHYSGKNSKVNRIVKKA